MADVNVVALLEENMRAEHAAIVQYLYHAFRLKGEFVAEMQEIAREEMRHLQWLAEALATLGRPPMMERGPVAWEGSTAAEALRLDAAAEERDLARYEQQASSVADPPLQSLFQRITADERVHAEAFLEMAAEADKAGAVLYPRAEEVDRAGLSAEELAQDVALLGEALRLEYTVVLQYLYQTFVVESCALRQELFEDQAQESMKHMGWLAEAIVDLGGLPLLEAGPIAPTTDEQEILALNLRLEQAAHDQYALHLAKLRHPRARATLSRIFEQESFHIAQFARLQGGVAAGAPRPRLDGWPHLTVGSLFGRRQE